MLVAVVVVAVVVNDVRVDIDAVCGSVDSSGNGGSGSADGDCSDVNSWLIK